MAIPCEKEVEIARLKDGGDAMLSVLREMSTDLKAMRTTMESVSNLAIQHEYHQEALGRAFVKIESLEGESRKSSDFVIEVKSMARMAWWIWSLLAGGLGLVILKVFNVIGVSS